MNQPLMFGISNKYIKNLALVGLFVLAHLNLFANEFKEAAQKSTFLIATDDSKVINGMAKSNFNTIPYKIIDFYPNEIPDNVIYYKISYSSYTTYTVYVYLQHNDERYEVSKFSWIRGLETASELRAFYNYIDQTIAEYIQFVDEKGRINQSEIDAERKKKLVQLANDIKSSTYYANSGSQVKTNKWDKKNGKVVKYTKDNLALVIESSSDTNGYYITTQKKNRFLWTSGFFTLGAGFLVAPFVPKYLTTVYSTNSDQALGAFRMYNPKKNTRKVQKKMLKFQNIK